MTNASIFLDTFAAMERHLRSILRANRSISFYPIVDMAAEKSSIVRRYKDDLKEYADLRNAIVHERSDGRAIAEPHASVVAHIRNICRLVMQPPQVLPTFGKTVQTVNDTELIRDALKYFFPRNFSQIPVVGNGRLIGLLTSNTISRWLASEGRNDMVDLRDHSVSDALKFTEHEHNWCLVGREAPLTDIVDWFDRAEASGKRLDAVLITQSGRPTESLLGIITLHDMPKVLRGLSAQARS